MNQGNLPIFPQGVSHADVAPTVLDHFDIPLPDRYAGVSHAAGAISINPDINGDGIVSGDGTGEYANDDVVAFVSLWLQPNTIENPNPADLNLDGIANLADWAVLNQELPSMGAAVLHALQGAAVPEPASALLAVIASLGLLASRTRSPYCIKPQWIVRPTCERLA